MLSVQRHRGFTMVEILVAMVVLMILAGLLFVGGRSMVNNQKKQTTATMLQNLRAMATERETVKGATPFKAEVDVAIGGSPSATAIGSVEADSPGRTHAAVTTSTKAVMNLLLSIPANKQTLANIPPDQLMENQSNPPIILDGWNNPIIACPSTGLTDVSVNGVGGTVFSPDKKPFFASAGPDGSFATGDDNQYSFQN